MNSQGGNIFKGILITGVVFLFMGMYAYQKSSPIWETNNWKTIENYVEKNGDAKRKIAVFDHDGTLIHGDITEGIAEKSIPGVLKALVDGKKIRKEAMACVPDNYKKNIWGYYRHLEEKNRQIAYEWYPTLFSGYSEKEIRRMADSLYSDVFSRYQHAEMVELVKYLQGNGYEIYIISASPTLLVQAASLYWNIPEENIFGIDISSDEAGILQPEVAKPITYAEGKVAKILEKISPEKGDALIIAGDSLKTDLAMLRYAKDNNGLAILVNATGTNLDKSRSMGFINETMIIFP